MCVLFSVEVSSDGTIKEFLACISELCTLRADAHVHTCCCLVGCHTFCMFVCGAMCIHV